MSEDRKIEPTWIYRGPGSGALSWEDAMVDSNPRRPSNDGRSETNTTFYSRSDISPPTDHVSWEELASINDGMRSPNRSKHNHESDKTRFIEVLCSELDCTDYQHEQVYWVVNDLGNLREFYPTVPYEHIILAVISLVVDQETEDFDRWIVRRDDFKRLMEDLQMEMSRLWSIRQKVTEESSVIGDE